jgi:predicted methyltransferase MtxX (methanogen marker protein 4)
MSKENNKQASQNTNENTNTIEDLAEVGIEVAEIATEAVAEIATEGVVETIVDGAVETASSALEIIVGMISD